MLYIPKALKHKAMPGPQFKSANMDIQHFFRFAMASQNINQHDENISSRGEVYD